MIIAKNDFFYEKLIVLYNNLEKLDIKNNLLKLRERSKFKDRKESVKTVKSLIKKILKYHIKFRDFNIDF